MLSPSSSFNDMNPPDWILDTSFAGIGGKDGDRTSGAETTEVDSKLSSGIRGGTMDVTGGQSSVLDPAGVEMIGNAGMSADAGITPREPKRDTNRFKLQRTETTHRMGHSRRDLQYYAILGKA